MNILFFTRLFYPHIGGVEKHVFEVSQILIQQGHTVTIVAEKHNEKLPEKEIIKNLVVYRISLHTHKWVKKYIIWKWLWSHRFLLKNADIVHCHDVFYWFLPFRLFFLKKKVYTTFHGYESYPISKKAIIVRKVSEVLSQGTICVGEFMKKWYHAKPDFVIYGGVTIPRRESTYKSIHSAVFIGRLDDQTGILTYVNAAKKLKSKFRDFEFTIVGDGVYKNRLSKTNRVLGFQQNSEIYFQQYHFAFVSRYLSILEAIAHKRLVFAVYDNKLKKDYLHMTPFAQYIITAFSEKEIISRVIYYLNHPEAEKEKIEKAYQWVKNWTWQQVFIIYKTLWGIK